MAIYATAASPLPIGSRREGYTVMKKQYRMILSLAAALLMLFCTAMSAAALDDTYRFEDHGMSVKISKNYYVVTRDTPQDDPVFTTLNLNYRETMNLFEQADIYLRAYDPNGSLQISLTVLSSENSKSVNNYAELNDAERKGILDVLQAEPSVTSAVMVKRGEYIFFDSSRSSTLNGEPLYINQCNTVVNGLQIDISLQKSKETITPTEANVLTAIASSIEFDSVSSAASSGPVFDWWRMLLWVAILAGLTVAISFGYKRQNEAQRRRLEERRRRRAESAAAAGTAPTESPAVSEADGAEITFEETLGYRDADRFSTRAAADLDYFDISVKEKSPSRGVSYFEDEGKSIDDRSDDYFDTYFKEHTPTRSGIARLTSTVGANLAIWFRHLGYFFKNLLHIFTRKKKQ